MPAQGSKVGGLALTSFGRQVRAEEWVPSKLPELAVAVTALVCGANSGPPGAELFVAFIGSAALLAYGYAWNDRCDWESDRIAGKQQRASRPSAQLCTALAGSFLVLSLLAGAGRPTTIAASVATLALAWSYSAPPVRWKVRGRFGLVVGSGAQRVLPLLVMATVVNPRWTVLAAAAIWLESWGLRAMVVHQVLDAHNDRRSGVRTWATGTDPIASGHRLLRITVPIELGAFCAMVWLVAQRPAPALALVVVPGLGIGWLIRRKIVGYGGEIGWFSFGYQPLSAIYAITGPLVLDLVLFGRFGTSALGWLLATVLLSVVPVARLLDHLVDRPELDHPG